MSEFDFGDDFDKMSGFGGNEGGGGFDFDGDDEMKQTPRNFLEEKSFQPSIVGNTSNMLKFDNPALFVDDLNQITSFDESRGVKTKVEVKKDSELKNSQKPKGAGGKKSEPNLKPRDVQKTKSPAKKLEPAKKPDRANKQPDKPSAKSPSEPTKVPQSKAAANKEQPPPEKKELIEKPKAIVTPPPPISKEEDILASQ